MINNINNIIDDDIQNLLGIKKKIQKDTLVLSGGSLKGVAQIGALHCLKQNDLLKNIKNIASTSIGSIVGFLYSIGYQPYELFELMKKINLKMVKKFDITNFISNFGLDDGKGIMLIIKKLMQVKKIDESIRFKDFYIKTGINYIVTGTCLNDKNIYYFSHTNFPNMKVLDAIRISISIPIIFTPVIFEGKTFIDGGCIDNFPIHLFNHKIENVIGIYVTETRNYSENIKCFENFFENTFQCLFEGVAHGSTKGYDKYIIKIKCVNYDESLTSIISLFDDGFNAAAEKIKNGDFIQSTN